MRLVIILIAIGWGISAVWAFAWSASKSRDAKLTAAYILLWPLVAVILLLNEPVPLWLSVPVIFGFLPWLLAGPHLSAILTDSSASQPDEIIGIPRSYWKWGGLAAVLLGLLFDGYA
ncbi:hypothetical protein [Thiorhodococcus minor]|uniref:Uncharacterized protein n=1 Tax=Thiorhodococcus minor TaxID=57489 RepID=A0A6M0JY13_9GAMM|nr:hypothetical protein [Thiorhodococcus minor]NEV62416.1 hypothetical protein [Thiorhodococcus minor]